MRRPSEELEDIARALEEAPDWTREAFAVDRFGLACSSRGPEAVAFSAIGAGRRAGIFESYPSAEAMMAHQECHDEAIPESNANSLTRDEVIAKLRESRDFARAHYDNAQPEPMTFEEYAGRASEIAVLQGSGDER